MGTVGVMWDFEGKGITTNGYLYGRRYQNMPRVVTSAHIVAHAGVMVCACVSGILRLIAAQPGARGRRWKTLIHTSRSLISFSDCVGFRGGLPLCVWLAFYSHPQPKSQPPQVLTKETQLGRVGFIFLAFLDVPLRGPCVPFPSLSSHSPVAGGK